MPPSKKSQGKKPQVKKRQVKRPQHYIPEGVRKNWASGGAPPAPEQTKLDLAHPANDVDHGFNHINTVASPPRPDPEPFELPDFTNDDPNKEDAMTAEAKKTLWIDLVRQKLTLAREYIKLERALGLDPNRRKDSTADMLLQGPIAFELTTQENIRDIVNIRIDLETSCKGKEDETGEKMQAMGAQYLFAWKLVREWIVVYIPGDSEDARLALLERIMIQVFGKMVLEADRPF